MAVVCLHVHACVGHQHACSKLHWLPSETGQYWINHDNSIDQHYWETPSGMCNHCVCLCVSIHACVSVYMIVQVCVRLCVWWISARACLCVCVCVCARRISAYTCLCVCVCDEYLHMRVCVCVRWLSARSTALHGLLALTAVSKPLLSAYRPSTHPTHIQTPFSCLFNFYLFPTGTSPCAPLLIFT